MPKRKQRTPVWQGPLLKILVVDDDPGLRRVLSAVLAREGNYVIEAGCGEEALSILVEHHGDFDLLFTGVVMPRMDGSTLAVEARRIWPGLPVLYMSGNDPGRFGRMMVPKSAFLRKPFGCGAVYAAIQKLSARLLRERAPRIARTAQDAPGRES